jgi:CheY-like chemotaxis protein
VLNRGPGLELSFPLDQVQFLVVDDHVLIRHIVGECMKSYKIRRCANAEDGADALRQLRSLSHPRPASLEKKAAEPPGFRTPEAEEKIFRGAESYCVITDFNMPGVNGLQLLKAIRCGETDVPRNTPVVMLTSISEEFVVASALQLDVSGFVLKPVVQKNLWDRVQKALKKQTTAKAIDDYRAVDVSAKISAGTIAAAARPKH